MLENSTNNTKKHIILSMNTLGSFFPFYDVKEKKKDPVSSYFYVLTCLFWVVFEDPVVTMTMLSRHHKTRQQYFGKYLQRIEIIAYREGFAEALV
jgi:hypothetical protein